MALKLAPTKSNLFKLQNDLAFAKEGYQLLDRKREVLIMELMQIVHSIKNLHRRLSEKLEKAYTTFKKAYVDMGSEEIERANYAMLDKLEISMNEKSVMGVPLPKLRVTNIPKKTKIGILGTSEYLGISVNEFSKAIPLLIEYAEANLTLTRLASEIQKTQRRVNALENIFIPDATETIKYISEVLEENDRENFSRRKQVKKMIN